MQNIGPLLMLKKSMVCTSFVATLQRSNTILELGQKKIHASNISDPTKNLMVIH